MPPTPALPRASLVRQGVSLGVRHRHEGARRQGGALLRLLLLLLHPAAHAAICVGCLTVGRRRRRWRLGGED